MSGIQQQPIYPRDAYADSQYCKFFLNCAQASGDLVNDAPSGTVAAKHASFADATCWATAGYATVGGSATNYAAISVADSDLDIADGTVVIHARLQKVAAALPGAEQYWFAGYRPGSSPFGGIILSMHTTGAIRLFINSTDNAATVTVASAANTYSNGTTANEISITAIIPRETGGTAYLIINGITETSGSTATLNGKSTGGGRNIRLGVSHADVGADAARIRAVQGYVIPKDASALNRSLVADWFQRNPHLQAPDWVFGL